MKGLLDSHAWHLFFPKSATTWFTSFAHHNVAVPQTVFFDLVFFESHLPQIVQIESTPAHIYVGEVRAGVALVLPSVQHLAETEVSDIGESCHPPVRFGVLQ